MSSDESTSTQISAISSQAGNGQNLKPHKSEQWEINLIGNFLLTLYHRLVITPQNEWICKKIDIRREFLRFVTPELSKRLKDVNGTDNIGTLLHRCGFLFNTPRGSNFYKLKSKVLFEFRNKKLTEQDKRRVNDDASSNTTTGPEDILRSLTESQQTPILQVNYEIDEESPVHPVQYEGTTMQERRANYYPTNMSCFICQLDFATMDGYEEHIQTHNDEKDFQYLKELSRFDSPIFTVSYRLCKNSHHFCFTIATQSDNLVIEKIVIVQSRSMFYVHNMRVPYDMPANGRENFYVDSHLFAMFVEQPIVLVCHIKESKGTRIVEEHHFMRDLEFPKINFAIKPYRLPSNKTFSAKFKLPEYFPPLEIRNALSDDFIYEKLMQTSNEFRDYVRNGKILQPQTIGPTLTTLLHIEDMDAIKDYLKLLQQNIKLRSFGDNYSMRLRTNQHIYIENVLSLFDDVIITTRKDIKADSESLVKLILQNREEIAKTSDTYVGQIEDVNSGRVSFKCYKKLDLQRTYTIIFRPSRLQLRYQYRAMELLPVVMQFLKKFLFPGQLLPKAPSTLSLQLYNKDIYKNPEQLQAVQNIAEGPRNDATYIIFGPPGTGKTTTLVESILQVLKRDDTKILVTASSNSACDEVALRLCKILSSIDMTRAIVRVYAQSNEARMDTIDDLLLEHSNMYSVHFYPDVEVLHEYRIVVCTMAVVAKLSTGKFGRRENGGTLYTHLFIDEVAASTEVEALMAITSILTPKSCLIIAGDHKQLGPIVKSKRAEEFKLAVSLMDRLLERECYRVNTDTGNYDRTVQSRLRLNFRSHPAIVNLYSGMYYNHDLEAKANIDDVSLVKDWHMAPSKDFPIIFHSIAGKSYSDNQSYSLFNSDEINIVMDYVKDLMYFGINGKPVRESDIGVISPYKKQYLRIREELNLRKWYQIETGSVETFQGKEKEIIIVSFVRSGTATLGFLESPRRLNVTLSRAKSLLILIGNASTLSMNPDYDYIIKECQRHQTLIGRIETFQTSSASASNNDEKTYRRGNNRYKPYNEKDGPIDMVNKSLKDLKLKNNNENSSRAKKNQRQQGRKNNVFSDKGRENNNNNESDNGDEDDDNESDEDNDKDVDNKPSTSKTTGRKNHLSQNMKKKNQPQTRDLGKNGKSNRGDKQNTRSKQSSKPNLESYFNELPSVPNADTIIPTAATTAAHINQVPPLMQHLVQRPQTPTQQSHHHNYVQPNSYPFNPMQAPPQRRYGPPQQMGISPAQPNYPIRQPHQHQLWQQGQQLQFQYQQQQHQQHLQHQHQQQHLQQLQQELQLQQLLNMCSQNNNHLPAAGNLKTTNDTSKIDNTSASKNARRRRNERNIQKPNTAKESKDDGGDDDDEEKDSTATTSKATPGKQHLAHSMKKKNHNQNAGKIAKTNLTLTEIKEVVGAKPKSVTPRTMQPTTTKKSQVVADESRDSPKNPVNAAHHNAQEAVKISKQQAKQPQMADDGLTTNMSKKPDGIQKAKQSPPKVIASIPPMLTSSDTKPQAANMPSATSTTQYSSSSLSRPTYVNSTSVQASGTSGSEASSINRPTGPANVNSNVSQISGNRTSSPFVSTSGFSQYASNSINRPTAADKSSPTSSQKSIGSLSLPQGTSPNVNQYSSSSLNRSAAAVNIYPSLNQRPNSLVGQTTVRTTTTTNNTTNTLNPQRPSTHATSSASGNNERISLGHRSSDSYARSSSILAGAEALHYNQPYRPVRDLREKEKKENNCVIA